MNPIPVIVIIFCVLVFEQALIGDEVAQSVAAIQIPTVPSNFDACNNQPSDDPILAVSCKITGFLAGAIGIAVTVLNFAIYLGGLAAFPIPGAPWWVTSTLQAGLSVSLIYCIVVLLRGVK